MDKVKMEKDEEVGAEESIYACRHAERLDTNFPNWFQLIQTNPFNWPPGFIDALSIPMEVIPVLIREGLDENDTPLTSRGCFQAQMTGEALREKGITQIFCSPVLRCVQTAAEISKIIGVPIKIEPGAMETLDKRWYSSQPVFMNWKAVGNVLGFNIDTAYCSPFVLPSESEGLSDWTERTISFIRHLTSNYVRKGERVLIVTHGFSVVAIPWITMSEHPPLLGYCCLAATFRRPFSTSMSVSTRHLEVGLPPAILSVEDDVTLWLSAAEGIDRDTAGCICAWRDRGVHGYTAAQPRGIFRPKFGPSRTLKHVSVAIFDGNDDFLLAPVAESLRSFTIAALVKPARLLDLELLFSVDPYKEAAGLELRVDKTGAVGVFAGNTAVAVARNALILNRWSIVIVRVRNGREARVWVDFTRCVAGGALKGVCTSFGPWQGLHIFGGSPSVRPFCGSLAELIVVNKALGDPQIDQLNNYFVSKF